MPLKIKIDLIPKGDVSKTRRIYEIDISNNTTGTEDAGNYHVVANGYLEGGWDTFFASEVNGINRKSGDDIDYLRQCAEILNKIIESDRKS